ncbi:putative late blight resistance protein homolog R1B-16 isoform X2 [Salvia hispanica]|uniref:putative late blight resistance protein homolog R1B-16 isoform X2 n=1 Tax=Salvia hispanica TaxID=49212 RepID=UPI002009920C|nr:putative late blight resistance protein homolog R1B-16 isoform X2 [Salvia hispanica]
MMYKTSAPLNSIKEVIENMNLIKIEIDEKMVLQDQQHIIKPLSGDVVAAGSSKSTSTAKNVTMIGFDDVLLQMLDKITGGGSSRQIIPIVGMGGIGKTTLARNIYVSPLVQESFDVCAWSTISQGYNAREILRQILDQVDGAKGGDLSVDELGDYLYKYLFGRKYFIVMDDMWTIEAWDRVRRFFPDNNNGSRMVVTTRLSNLASQFNYSNGLDLEFLDEDASWDLFCKTVFGEEACPLELEDIGKKIVQGCKGLPLSVAVIGGLLSKSERTKESWGLFEKNISSIVNLDDNENCLQVLYTSYNNLPAFLKPCFLYMGIYDEDEDISIFEITLLLVTEGLVKPINGKSLEEAAEEYMEELVDRNMVIVENRKHSGKLKTLKMHDLLRDVCVREGRKLKFLSLLEEGSFPQAINSQRRIVRRSKEDEYPTQILQLLDSASLLRSFLGSCPRSLACKFRLSRVLLFEECFEQADSYEKIFRGLVNLRVLGLTVDMHLLPRIPSSVCFHWNLQSIYLSGISDDFVLETWKVSQLRHVITDDEGKLDGAYCLPNSLTEEEDTVVLENLQTLYNVKNLKFGEGVLKRIPNVKKLKLYYDASGEEDCYALNNLHRLHKLETLRLVCDTALSDGHLVQEVIFPRSLKKLILKETYLPWEDMNAKIGLLPLLQVLQLERNSFAGSEWETMEDQFLSLKFLQIEHCDLECWITDDTHFPSLEHIVLSDLSALGEIPLSIGDIPTLQSIKMSQCSQSVVDSAERIQEEQLELGNENLLVLNYSMKNL